jgi:hypothetical protein
MKQQTETKHLSDLLPKTTQLNILQCDYLMSGTVICAPDVYKHICDEHTDGKVYIRNASILGDRR